MRHRIKCYQEGGFTTNIFKCVAYPRRDREPDRLILMHGHLLNLLLITESNECGSKYGDCLCSFFMIMIATYASRLGHHDVHIALIGYGVWIQRLEYEAPCIMLNVDFFDNEIHRITPQ